MYWLPMWVTAVGSLARAEHDILGVIILDVIWPIQVAIVVEEPCCDLKILSWAKISLLT